MSKTQQLRLNFLKHDFRDALKGLCIAAVTWEALPSDPDYRRGMAASACFVQARALYEFFYKTRGVAIASGKGASAHHFVSAWTAKDEDGLHKRYMDDWAPAQRRVFHLVYDRAAYSGGVDDIDETDHLKNQVLKFAKDLLRLSREFIDQLKDPYRSQAKEALAKTLQEAEALSKRYGISNPLVN